MTIYKNLDDFPALKRGMKLVGLDPNPKPPRRSRRRTVVRHGVRCKVCCHPDREAIEQAYLDWISPEIIAREYGIAHHSSIYRHVHATGLYSRRRNLYRSALDRIIEHAGSAKITGRDVVNAVRAACCISDDVRWVEPVRRVIFIRETPSGPVSEPSRASAIDNIVASSVPKLPDCKDSPPQIPPPVLANLIANHVD